METNQKIQLAKRGKTICPNCGKRSFVNYIFVDSGAPVAGGVCGRCDRADNCGFHCPPRQYFAETGTTFKTDIVKSIRPQRPTIQHPTFVDAKYVEMSLRCPAPNPLKIFLHNTFDELFGGGDVVNQVLANYLVGTSTKWGGATVFWQIDSYCNIRAGKIMGYDAKTGKRLKNPHPLMTWVHTELKDRYPNFALSQAFFGAHLVDSQSVIWLFESEKTALIVAIVLGWLAPGNHAFVPIAAGGCGGFNPSVEKLSNRFDKLQTLKNRRIVLFPDQSQFREWCNRAELLRGWCSEVYISPIMETDLAPEQYQPQCPIDKGDDLADVILNYIRSGKAAELATLMMNLYDIDIPGTTNKYKLI